MFESSLEMGTHAPLFCLSSWDTVLLQNLGILYSNFDVDWKVVELSSCFGTQSLKCIKNHNKYFLCLFSIISK